jgi:Ala-tRNA(Pro) deacylase
MTIATGVSEFLRDHRIPYEVLWHRRADTSLRAAREAGVSPDQVVKAVVLEGDGELFMALIPADRMLDIGAISKCIGTGVRLADPGEFENIFDDCRPGAVPAAGPKYGFPTLLDDHLAGAADVYFDAGDQEELIHVKGSRFRSALGPVQIGEFTRESQSGCGPAALLRPQGGSRT